jgi:hypothetical protein
MADRHAYMAVLNCSLMQLENDENRRKQDLA